MTETDVISTDAAPESPADPGASTNGGTERRRRGGITGMVLAELRELAGTLGVDTTGLRRGDLIAEIRKRQAGAAQLPLGDDAAPTDEAAPEVADVPEAPESQVTEAPAAESSAPAEAAEPVTEQAAEPAAEAPKRRGGRRRVTASSPTVPVETPTETPTEAVTETPAQAPVETAAADADVTATTDAVPAPASTGSGVTEAPDAPADGDSGSGRPSRNRNRRSARRDAGAPGDGGAEQSGNEQSGNEQSGSEQAGGEQAGEEPAAASAAPSEQTRQDRQQQDRQDRQQQDGADDQGGRDGGRGRGRGDQRQQQGQQQQGQQQNGQQQGQQQNQQNGQPQDDDDEDGGGRRRGRRFRDRRRNRGERGNGAPQGQGQGQGGGEPEVRDDDVLIPVAGILDVLDNYAFVRTSGYSSGPNDVYVSLSLVRKHGLRRGDAVTGQVRQQREGEQNRQKFNPLVRIDSINGLDPEQARRRPEFQKLTPLYPNERLRLETDSSQLTNRVIDLVMPVGKGQRALIVSPPKAGKTTIMQNLANAITTNNPEVHLMVVLVDERPEEVTDMQRSVKGEVIASTFDRPPSDHTSLSELAIERAKRLVEMGHDVVVLLDNITRLGRAYNLAAPASGRILSGGVDSTALYPPKRFLGAARNIEEGGSLTIFATALVETGSTMDTVIFEEFKGTGNAELKLDRKIADKRVFPAIDIGDSGTRKEELLMSPDEHAVVVKLRRVLAALDDQQAIDLVLSQLRKTRTNIEFLMQVSKNTPGKDED